MKKIITIILAAVMCFGANSICMANDVLTALDIMPESNNTKIATRDLLAYSAVKLVGGESVEDGEIPFTDINENMYIEYIRAAYNRGIMNGTSDKSFEPNGEVTKAVANAAIVRALGYESVAQAMGTGMEGYIKAADIIGINKNIGAAAEKSITVEELRKMLKNTLESNVIDVKLDGTSNISIEKKDEYFLNEVLGYTVYKGTITELSNNNKTAQVEIYGEKYTAEKDRYLPGSLKLTSKNVDLTAFQYIYAYIWVNSEDEIVYVEPADNTEVIYSHIYSVNGDTNENSIYKGKYLNKIVLTENKNKKYSFAGDAVIEYNGEAATETSAKYAGRFIKAVIKDDDVVYAQVYDTALGGLAKSVSEQEIEMLGANGAISRISDIDKLDDVIVYIDSQKSDISNIKKNSVISYYLDDTRLFIEASEKTISEVLNSVGDDEIIIGGTAYDKKDTYYSTDGEYYKLNDGMNSLYNIDVTAYFDAAGYCVYVCPKNNSEVKNTNFLGAVLGYGTKRMDDVQMKIYVLEPTAEVKVFDVSDKVKYEDGITESEIIAASQSFDADAVYLFETNSEGKINKISGTKPVYGFDKSVFVTYFADVTTDPYVGMSTDAGYKTLFFGNAPIYVFYSDRNGDPVAQKITWENIRNLSVYGGNRVKLSAYGRDLDEDPRLVVLTGAVDKIYYEERYFGVVTQKERIMDEKGNYLYKITIESNTKRIVTVSEAFGDSLPANAGLLFYTARGFGLNDELLVDGDILDLSGAPETWDIDKLGIKHGKVKRMEEKRLFVDDGTTYGNEYGNPLYVTLNVILEYDKDATNSKYRFKRITYDKVKPGSDVYYYVRGELRGMIVVPE